MGISPSLYLEGAAREAQTALNRYEESSRTLLDCIKRRAKLDAGHAQAKLDAIARLMAGGMTKTAAEAAARTDPEFAAYCERETRAGIEVTRAELHLQHLLETAKLYRTLVGQGVDARDQPRNAAEDDG